VTIFGPAAVIASLTAFLIGLERGCVEDQPQHARNVLRLALRARGPTAC